jgi:hypothetical protein
MWTDKFSGFPEQIVRSAVTEIWSQIICIMQERTFDSAHLTSRYKLHVGGFKEWEVKQMRYRVMRRLKMLLSVEWAFSCLEWQGIWGMSLVIYVFFVVRGVSLCRRLAEG